MIRSLLFNAEGQCKKNIDPADFERVIQDPEAMLWVDFQESSPEEDQPILLNTFHFHPLAVDDALQESHVPKVDDWGDYLYVVLQAMVLESQTDGPILETRELDAFLGKNYLVTHHDLPIHAIDRVWDMAERTERHLKFGPDHLLYQIVDEVVAAYMPVVEGLDDLIEQTEDTIFSNPSPQTLERIFKLKRGVLRLRQVLSPQREVLNRLARDDFAVIDAKDRVYFRDVYDHLVRMHDITESVRDLVSGALDSYLSAINNRMNDIMKTLTIITTLFMPLTFITSFFGMNFFVPEPPLSSWVSRGVFVIVMLSMFVTPAIMFLWMRRRHWM